MKRTANAIKRLPQSLSRGSPRPAVAGEAAMSPLTKTKQSHTQKQSSSRKTQTPQSTPQSLSKGRAAKAADKLKRYTTFGNVSPGADPRRRNSTAGLTPNQQSVSGSTSSRRSLFIPPSSDTSQMARRKSDSLQLPAATHQRGLCRAPTSSSSISPTPSPTTPEDQVVTGSSLTKRLLQVMRSTSRRSVKGKSFARPNHAAGRTSVETFDIPRRDTTTDIEDENRLTMRASSWSSPRNLGDEDDRSFDIGSDTVAGFPADLQDFNRSVVLLGAGGYIESPSTPDSVATSFASAGYANGSSTSSDSTVRPPQHCDPGHYPPRVRSPLSRTYRSDFDDENNSVFDTRSDLDDPADIYEEGEDTLEVQTRRPSAVLSRSANTSPLRR